MLFKISPNALKINYKIFMAYVHKYLTNLRVNKINKITSYKT